MGLFGWVGAREDQEDGKYQTQDYQHNPQHQRVNLHLNLTRFPNYHNAWPPQPAR